MGQLKGMAHQILIDLCGKQRLECEDPRWIDLFQIPELTLLSGTESYFTGLLNELVRNNGTTGNCIELIDQTVSRMRAIVESRDQRSAPSHAKILQCCTAMHLSGLVFNNLLARLSTAEIQAQLRLPAADWVPSPSSSSGGASESGRSVGSLIDTAVDILSSNPLPSYMCEVAYCSANLLLCVFSTELYDDNGELLFMDYLQESSKVQVKLSLSAGAEKSKDTTWTMPACFLRGLLTHSLSSSSDSLTSKSGLLALNKLRSSESKGDGEGTNFLFLLIQRLWRMGSDSEANDKANTGSMKPGTMVRVPKNPLQERCKNLLCVLLYSTPPRVGARNYIMDMFLSLTDQRHEAGEEMGREEEQEQEKKVGKEAGPFKSINADFGEVAAHVGETLPAESSVLLLYALLHKHPTFMDYITSSDDRIRSFVVSVLRGLYLIGDGYPTDSLYVLVICLLLLVQSPQVQKKLSSLRCSVPWYREHFLSDVRLADLVLLCTLRVTMLALFRLNDQYLISNCFAIMLDLAHNIADVGCYVSERVSKVIIQLARRLNRGYHEGEAQAAQFETTFETLAIMMKLCGIALRPARREANAHLLYALVHESEKISAVLPEREGGDGEGGTLEALQAGAEQTLQKEPSSLLLPREVVRLAHSYYEKLQGSTEDGQGHYNTADAAVSALQGLIREDTEAAGGAPADDPSTLRYSYSEGSESAAFFTPLAWAVAVRMSPDIHWHPQHISLFDPVACGVVAEGAARK